MSLLTLAVPVVAVLCAAVFLDEGLGWVQAAGMVVVLGALGVVARQTARPVAPAASAAAEPDVREPAV